jgi:hypothetical protein
VAVTLAWSVNELADGERKRLLAHVIASVRRGASVLVLEPLARSAVPWWEEWADAFAGAGGRADEWKFAMTLPEKLVALDEAAGFRREALGVRTLWVPALAPGAGAGPQLMTD